MSVQDRRHTAEAALDAQGQLHGWLHDARYLKYLAYIFGDDQDFTSKASRDMQTALREAECYGVSTDVVELLQVGVDTCPLWPLAPFDLPSPVGYVWFEEPYVVHDVHGRGTAVRSMLWWTLDDSVVIVACTDPNSHLDDYHDVSPAGVWDQCFSAISTWNFGADADTTVSSSIITVANKPTKSESLRSSAQEWMQLCAAFWRFVQEPWIEHREVLPARPARRRADRAQISGGLHVVRLRAPEKSAPTASGDGHREYSHRFMVRPHWRNQWYPSIEAHRPKFIPAYIKGPADKPLVVKDTVYLVDR
jgi:hypothetical protein